MRLKSCVSVFFLLILAVSAHAQITVACAGSSNPGQFGSITDALNALPFDGPQTNFIVVSGNCTENVTVNNRRNIVITGGNQVATITSADPANVTIHLLSSRGIVLQNLLVDGGDQGILLNNSSEAVLVDTSIQHTASVGIHAQIGSTMNLSGVTVQNNDGDGIEVDGGSNATLAGTDPNTFVRSIGNGGFGLFVDGSTVNVNSGLLTIEGNGAAVNAVGSRVVFFAPGGGTGNVFRNNAAGFTVQGSTVTFFGNNLIQNNGAFGVFAIGSTVSFNGQAVGTTIEGHSSSGMFIDRSSNVTLNGRHKILHNGSATTDPLLSSGIFVNMGGVLLSTRLAEISDNFGFGIGADQLATVTIDAIKITNNAREGVHLGHMSNGFFGSSLTFGGNGFAAITCDTTSHAFVDSPKDFTGTNCKNIQKK